MISWCARRWHRLRAVSDAEQEQGGAIVEFIFLGVLILVPLIYLVMVAGRIQAGSYAVTFAAREGGRAFVTSPSEGAAGARAQAAARLAFDDQGFAGGTIDIACSDSPCLSPSAELRVTAEVRVPLPLVPAFVADAVPLSVPVSTSYVATVERFKES